MGDTEVVVDEWGEVFFERARVPDLERAARNRERSVKRARAAVRDYVVFNQTTKMWTFTYAKKCFSVSECRADVHDFVKRWRDFEGRPFPYVYVIEPHQDGSFHVHFAVRQDHFTDFFVLRRLWGHGRIRFDKQRAARDGSRRSMLRLASYMTKYLAKTFGDEVVKGQHSYEVGEGFVPGRESKRFANFQAASEWLASMNSELRPAWFSGDDETWEHSWPCWTFEAGP